MLHAAASQDADLKALWEEISQGRARNMRLLAQEEQLLASSPSVFAESRNSWRQIVREAISILENSATSAEGVVSDAADDKAAWESCVKEIRAEKGGNVELDELIQGLALRSKEPPRDATTVTLLTVHASKGLEFDTVYVVGLAESIMPSWQSISKGNLSPEMEEERRNCFVAITRTRKTLIPSRAVRYRSWPKAPSRFLSEMGFAQSPESR